MSWNEEYLAWVRQEAKRMKSDGCTGVADAHVDCCYEHDLAYRTGKDPRSAFRNGWQDAPILPRSEADARLRRCIQDESPFGVLSPMSWVRWAGVRLGRFVGIPYGPDNAN